MRNDPIVSRALKKIKFMVQENSRLILIEQKRLMMQMKNSNNDPYLRGFFLLKSLQKSFVRRKCKRFWEYKRNTV